MLLSVVSEVIEYIKGVNPRTVLTFVTGWGLVAIAICSTAGRIKNSLKLNETNNKTNMEKMSNKTIDKVESIEAQMEEFRQEVRLGFQKIEAREVETDAKLTKIMQKDPISKYKYGEVKEYAPQVTTYVAEKVVEEVKEEVEATPLVETTPLLKKKRKAKTSFVD